MAKVLMGPVLVGIGGTPIIGANVDGKPNFMTHAWRGRLNHPPDLMVGIAVERRRYTHKGITQNMTFSINEPSIALAKEAEYCGSVSGAKVPNKAEKCNFEVFYGKLNTAPLIEQCPVNIECSVVHALDLGTHTLFVGRIEETHISDNCFTDDRPDMRKVKPIYFSGFNKEGEQYFIFYTLETHPNDPQTSISIGDAKVIRHGKVRPGRPTADWVYGTPPIDVYGLYREALKPTSEG